MVDSRSRFIGGIGLKLVKKFKKGVSAMQQTETFKKEVTTKSDGRYLIYYNFAPESAGKEANQEKGEERK